MPTALREHGVVGIPGTPLTRLSQSCGLPAWGDRATAPYDPPWGDGLGSTSSAIHGANLEPGKGMKGIPSERQGGEM